MAKKESLVLKRLMWQACNDVKDKQNLIHANELESVTE